MHYLPTALRTCASSLATRRTPSLATAAATAAGRPLLSPYQASPQVRYSSHSPLGGAGGSSSRKKVTLGTLRAMHRRDEPIAVITAHDFPSAHVADAAGVDIVLVGDSLAMVALGMEDTSEVMVEEMLLHCRSVARATKAAFTVSLFLYFVLSHPLLIHPRLHHTLSRSHLSSSLTGVSPLLSNVSSLSIMSIPPSLPNNIIIGW